MHYQDISWWIKENWFDVADVGAFFYKFGGKFDLGQLKWPTFWIVVYTIFFPAYHRCMVSVLETS